MTGAATELQSRLSWLDVAHLRPPPRLIINPHAGQKLGFSTNSGTVESVVGALREAGLEVDVAPTQSARHGTELARQAVRDGCQLIIAAGGDGTVSEVGEGLVGANAALGIMPLGSVMNLARTLCIPRDLQQAAQTIAQGQVLGFDAGRRGERLFLEAAGVGLTAGLLGYFNRLDNGAGVRGVLRGTLRFLLNLGAPRLVIVADGRRFDVRAAMVMISNAPYVGAAYALAPDARVDDGLFDVLIFRGFGVPRLLVHLLLVAGARRLPQPPGVLLVRARSVDVARRSGRPLPVHVDGAAAGVTPAHFEIMPAALHVVVGSPDPGTTCAWVTESPRSP
jgi:YegS/Rv2252/BmrU family lipid kinase